MQILSGHLVDLEESHFCPRMGEYIAYESLYAQPILLLVPGSRSYIPESVALGLRWGLVGESIAVLLSLNVHHKNIEQITV